MMPLTLIEKYSSHMDEPNLKVKVKSVLSAYEKKLLVSFFVLDDVMEAKNKKTLLTLCRSIHERDLWIQCDCLESVAKPVFRINRTSSGNLYLHRITSRTEHDDLCLFKERTYNNQDRGSRERKPFLKKDAPFNLLGKKANGLLSSTEPKSYQNQKKGAGQPKLARALFHILEAAGLNVVSPANRLKPQYALLNTIKSLELIKGLSLSNYLELNPKRLKYRATCLKEDNAWEEGVEKHCLSLLRVKSFSEDTLEVIFSDKSTKTIQVTTRIYQSSGRFSERTAPYMALLLIGTTAESPWFYQPTKAYVMPTYSDVSYFPVDSFYEREVMRHLYRLYFDAMNKGNPFKIIKPLFDIEVSALNDEESQFVLPDFIIQKDNSSLIIEVNGSLDPVYLERKARTHEHMKHLGELFSFNACQSELEKKLNQEIVYLMNQINGWLGRH